jgi:hypothetical protein
MWKVETLISQILQAFYVQNKLCLYMETPEPHFFKSVSLTTSISLYAGSDTHMNWHWSCMKTCYGHAISASVLPPHLPARRQGRRGSGWALSDAVSVSASPRHQMRWRPSTATGHLHGRRHGLWRKEGGRTTGTPQQSPHLEFQGEPGHHDALQKRYFLCSHMQVVESFKGQNLTARANSPFQPVSCSLFVPALRVVILGSSDFL